MILTIDLSYNWLKSDWARSWIRVDFNLTMCMIPYRNLTYNSTRSMDFIDQMLENYGLEDGLFVDQPKHFYDYNCK